MAKSAAVTGICLHQLIAREEAVIKRVIAFSSSQGRNYQLADLHSAQIVIVSDDTPVDFAALNPEGCMIVRIAATDSEQPYDVLMTRPLLVTRVMRTLDDAGALLQSDAETNESAVTEVAEPEAPEPGPTEVSTGGDGDAAGVSAPDVSDTAESAEQDSSAEESAEKTVAAEQVTQDQDADMPEISVPEDIVQESAVIANPEQDVPPESELQPEVEEPTATTDDTAIEDITDSDAGHAQSSDIEEVATPVVPANDADGDTHHKALVVDDSAAIRKQLELELRAAGISADFAEDGEQALEKVAANHYDLIFLDIIMPGIDGYEACRQMRLRAELKKTPIIMLSAKTSPLDEVQGVIAGASTYLTKPVKSEQLQNTLKRVAMWIENFQAET